MKKSKIFVILLITGFTLAMVASIGSAAPSTERVLLLDEIPLAKGEVPLGVITNPTDGETVSGTVIITTTTKVFFYIDGTRVGKRGTSYSWDTTAYSDGSHTIRAYDRSTKTDETITVIVDNGGAPPGPGEKIAVFFSASDAYSPASLFTGWCTDILEAEGFTKFFYFRDSTNPQADMQEVDAYEDSEDTVFIYILGHGNNNGQHSYTAFRPSASIVYSNEFRVWYDEFEAPRKCLFVESCHSGDWADDHAATPYLAMSTSDETSLSYVGTFSIYGTSTYVGFYTYYFLTGISNGMTGVEAFNYAKQNDNYNQNGKIQDFSDYTWFVD